MNFNRSFLISTIVVQAISLSAFSEEKSLPKQPETLSFQGDGSSSPRLGPSLNFKSQEIEPSESDLGKKKELEKTNTDRDQDEVLATNEAFPGYPKSLLTIFSSPTLFGAKFSYSGLNFNYASSSLGAVGLDYRFMATPSLFIDATGQFENQIEKLDYINFSDPKYLSYTKSIFLNEIQEKMKNYELCIIHNQAIKEDKLALLFMSLASQNLIVLDSRKTAEKAIVKIELLRDEYQLPKLWFILNKTGYSPNVFVEAKKLWNKFTKKQIA